MLATIRFLITVGMVCLTTTIFGQTPTTEEIEELQNTIRNLETQLSEAKSKLEKSHLVQVREKIEQYGLPALSDGEELIQHQALFLTYSEEHEQAKWVSHYISPLVAEGNVGRTNDFRKDPEVSTETAVKADYWNSGFDRGHLAPSADFRWSESALSESYFYSNMSPQRPELNRKAWAELEGKLRAKVIANKEGLHVVTGAVLTKGLPTIGENKVSIPELYYKVALDIEGDETAGIAFLMPNGPCNYPIWSYAVSIDSIESLTGIDFFANLPDERENTLESSFDLKQWQTDEEKDDVLPLNPLELPKGCFNTVQAKYQIGSSATVCGTVVSTKFSERSSSTFLNLDKAFPNQVFTVTIWKDALPNFSYQPHIELKDQQVCFTGKITENKGTPSMNVEHEKSVEIYEAPEQ